jgi:Heterokaryon incompatibility protein (HET)
MRILRYSNMTSTPPFRHIPLKPGEDSFRLLRLPAAENATSPVRCEIFDARTSEWRDRYVAGSYVWGSELKTKAIKIDNQDFMVGDNLYDFLYACRSHLEPGTSVVLWIDAICIYLDRSRIKYRRNLKFESQCCEGFDFAY